ncbi:glycosyltransferase 61 family protein [Microcoleus sp. F10-C6]|uniref:glycosyltransferase 61 family protein n=1 Tax=unclassified Microcoleus TaxID=2642155 RepID=UPI002FD2AFA3
MFKQDNQNQLATVKTLIKDVLLCEEVIAFPLDVRMGKDIGGLIDRECFQLIEEAIDRDYWNDPYQEMPKIDKKEDFGTQIPSIEELVFFGGRLNDHFGHFLLESLSRLWAYEAFRQFDPYIFFYTPWGMPDYLEKNNYIYQVLSGFQIPHQKLIFTDRPIRLRKVIIPCQKYGRYSDIKNPEPIFLDFLKKFQFPQVKPTGFENVDKIYVSRSKLPANMGRIIGESLFEEYLISQGYKIFNPEKFEFFEQLTVYQNANKIIFSGGSAAHACLLLPDLQADVSVIFRWPGSNSRWDEVRQGIADQFRAYGKEVLSVDTVKGQYRFGLDPWSGLSNIDWYQASILLQKEGFVTQPFYQFQEINERDLAKGYLETYIKEIANRSEFIDFMIGLQYLTEGH